MSLLETCPQLLSFTSNITNTHEPGSEPNISDSKESTCVCVCVDVFVSSSYFFTLIRNVLSDLFVK